MAQEVQLPQTVAIAFGERAQGVWSKLAEELQSLRAARIPRQAHDGSSGLSAAILNALVEADAAILVLDPIDLPDHVNSQLLPFRFLWPAGDRSSGVLLVTQNETDAGTLISLIGSGAVEIVPWHPADRAAERLAMIVGEIRSRVREPVSAPARIEILRRSSAAQQKTADPNDPHASNDPASSGGSGDGADEAAEVVNFEGVVRSQFTDFAWWVVDAARRLGAARPQPDVCSVRRLLAALLLAGLDASKEVQSGTWLISKIRADKKSIRSRVVEAYPVLRQMRSLGELLETSIEIASGMTLHLRQTLDLAQQLVRESRGGRTGRISGRHLLGAMLVRRERETTADSFLRGFGLELAELRAALLRELPDWGVEDDVNVWRRLLDSTSPGAFSNLEAGLPSYAADRATGDDLIGITREVEAMASLASAWSVEPPLSIGLFGEWGSGKSFFMQKMKERVNRIASDARKSPLCQRDFGYYKNIVQVEFNAWHYVEGNLWASLVEHIFTNLRLEGIGEEDIDSEENIAKRQEKLLGEFRDKSSAADKQAGDAKAKLEQAEDSERKKNDLEEQARAASDRAVQAEQERVKAEKLAIQKEHEADASIGERDAITLVDLLNEVTGSKEIREAIRKDLSYLGITTEQLDTLQGVRDTMNQASAMGTALADAAGILRDKQQRWWLLAWALIGPAVFGVLVWAGPHIERIIATPSMRTMVGAISAAFTVLTGALGLWQAYWPKFKPVLDAVERLKKQRDLLEQRVEAARRARIQRAIDLDKDAKASREAAVIARREALDLEAEVKRAQQEALEKRESARAAAQEAQETRAEADRLQQEADALRPERRIATFIQDRANAKDYRSHLGVAALIRRDFDKLSKMFDSQRRQEAKGTDAGKNDLAIVNRIILYIDDLDRCPPDKVVEVLRAIHLLLAFPLFVVVVAVDARWMKRSLRDRFSLMLTMKAAQDGKNPVAQPAPEEIAAGPMATPDDYLEKIFQVPFWIRPMSTDACRNMVNSLSGDLVKSDGMALAAEPDKGSPGPADNGSPDSPVKPTADDANGAQASGEGVSGPAAVAEATAPVVTGPPVLTFQWSKVEPHPKALKLNEEERNYMSELAPLIGRSPRAVKRFINCYRLLKSALDPKELERAERDGTFRTTMTLLGLVTGTPEIAPSLLTDLRRTPVTHAPAAWARGARTRLKLDESGQITNVLGTITRLQNDHGVRTIGPLAHAANLVDRFSFSPNRAPASSHEQARPQPAPRKKPVAPKRRTRKALAA